MLGWLGSAVFMSLVGSWIVVKIYNITVHDILGPTANNVAKTSLFVSVFTGITTVTGMRAFSALVRRLRHGSQKISSHIDKRLQ